MNSIGYDSDSDNEYNDKDPMEVKLYIENIDPVVKRVTNGQKLLEYFKSMKHGLDIGELNENMHGPCKYAENKINGQIKAIEW